MRKKEKTDFLQQITPTRILKAEDLREEFGLDYADISRLKNAKILQPVGRGVYIVNHNYYEKSLLQELLENLQMEKIDDAIQCILELYERKIDEKNVNFYIFLMSFIAPLPEKLKEKVRTIKDSDVTILGEDIQNNIKYQAMALKFTDALSLHRTFRVESKLIRDEISLNLIKKARKSYSVYLKTIDKLIKDDRLIELKEVLDETSKNRKLKDCDNMLLLVTDIYLAVSMFKLFPRKLQRDITDKRTLSFIISGDFKEAETSSHDYVQKRNSDFMRNVIDSDRIGIILHSINELFDEIKDENYDKSDILISTKELVAVYNIVYGFMNAREDTLNLLNIFLEEKGLSKYRFIVLGQIRLSLIENESNFDEMLRVISHLLNRTFNFDKKEYISRFQDSISRNDLKKANVLLDILIESKTLESDELDVLKISLEKTRPKVFDMKPIE